MSQTDPSISTPKSVTRQELYELAWQEPMLRVAERFGVSSSYLARVFTELRIPRPAPGYWTQLEVGKAPPRPDLPTARPGDLTEWSPGTSVGSTVGSITKAVRAEKVEEGSKSNSIAVNAQDSSAASKPKIKRANPTAPARRHELLIGIKPHFLKTRKVENDILRPYKRLLVDVMSSEAKLDGALDAAQALFDACDKKGFHVGFAAAGEQMRRAELDLLETPTKRNYYRTLWAPERPTLVHVGGLAIGLTLFEMTEEVEMVYVHGNYLPVRDLSEQQLRRYSGIHYWRTHKEHASGRLCLQAYSPYWRVTWSKRWQEVKPGTFRSMVQQIVGELEAIAPDLARQLEEARIKAEEEHRQWQEERRRQQAEAERQRQEKNKQESRRDLLAAIASWDEGRRVSDYFASIEAELAQLPPEEALQVRERLSLAKDLVGHLDPMAQLKGWKAPNER